LGLIHPEKRSLYNLVILATAFLLIFPCIALAGQFKVVRVYDGDTVKAVEHDIEIKVRLAGIDTPETQKGKRKPVLYGGVEQLLKNESESSK
jgi:endonuclease YncB( thermonuclease family)